MLVTLPPTASTILISKWLRISSEFVCERFVDMTAPQYHFEGVIKNRGIFFREGVRLVAS